MLGTYGLLAVRVLQRVTPTQHGTSVYEGHLREIVTLIHIAESLAVELSLHVLATQVCRVWDSNLRDEALTYCTTAATDCW